MTKRQKKAAVLGGGMSFISWALGTIDLVFFPDTFGTWYSLASFLTGFCALILIGLFVAEYLYGE